MWSSCGPSIGNSWTHLAMVVKAGDGETQVKCYVNGQLGEESGTMQDVIGNNKAPLYIGFETEKRDHFNGAIDEVAFFNKALTLLEVRALFAWRDP